MFESKTSSNNSFELYEKGCSFCKKGKIVKGDSNGVKFQMKIVWEEGEWFFKSIHDSELVVTTTKLSIDYCPICGTKLGSE